MAGYRPDIPPPIAELIRHLPPELKRDIKQALRSLSSDPFCGTPLIGELRGRGESKSDGCGSFTHPIVSHGWLEFSRLHIDEKSTKKRPNSCAEIESKNDPDTPGYGWAEASPNALITVDR